MAVDNVHKQAEMQSARMTFDGRDDGPSSALEAFMALHHPERKAAEKLLLTNGLREAEEKRKMRQYGHLVNESVGFMAVPFSAFGSTVPSKSSKALERHGKTAEAGRGVGQLGEDHQFKSDGNMPPVFIC